MLWSIHQTVYVQSICQRLAELMPMQVKVSK